MNRKLWTHWTEQAQARDSGGSRNLETVQRDNKDKCQWRQFNR